MAANNTAMFGMDDYPIRRDKLKPKHVYIGLGVVVAAAVLALGLGMSLQASKAADTTQTGWAHRYVEDNRRIDCYPEGSSPQEEAGRERCEARGCVWLPSSTTPAAPECFYPPDGENVGLRVLKEEYVQRGKRWRLEIKADSRPFDSTIAQLTLTIEELSETILRFKIEDPADPDRYQVQPPLYDPPRRANDQTYSYRIQYDPFSLQILRKHTNTTIWDTSVGGLLFTDQFIQISTLLPTGNVYGFGENVHTTFRHDMNFKTWPMFARDEFPDENGNNLYGVHPFYECIEADGHAHGVFLYNSNAMEYGFTPAPMLTYRTIGGILDFYIMMGPSPENVIQQYTSLIGRPYMPPFWALGFQLSRYGYTDTSDIQAAVNRTHEYNIPQDVQYADIDYMHMQRDFTLDPINFSDLPDYFKELQEAGMRIIIILDPCIEVNETYPPYLKGRQSDVYIKWPSRDVMPQGDFAEYNNTDMMGYVWPEWKVVFPDFHNPATEDYWTDLIVDFKKTVDFDGIWIDMNEPANFGTNDDKAWNWVHGPPYWTLKCPNSTWDDPPYRPMAAYTYDSADRRVRLSDKTLCMVATHGNGTLRHYDVHNLYGHVQSQVTLRAMRRALGGRRGQVVTRSTFPGSGAVAGHWLGDNRSSWPHLRHSIIGLLEFNLFGIPYVGADICGFFGTASPELCKRWMQLGAFYTFSRNHNHKDSPPQDPGYYGAEVAEASREALLVRYCLLPYLYTLFHKAHVQGHTVIRPLFHEFPMDAIALGIDDQLMWGPALLISPILEENQSQRNVYLPYGRWYNYYTDGSHFDGPAYIIEPKNSTSCTGSCTSPPILHVRGGHIIPRNALPYIEGGSTVYTNTANSRRSGFNLLVALDEDNGAAQGDLFWDDGETIDSFEHGNYLLASARCINNSLHVWTVHSHNQDEAVVRLKSITVFGVSAETAHIVEDGILVNGEYHQNSYEYNEEQKSLYVRGLDLHLMPGDLVTITWSERNY